MKRALILFFSTLLFLSSLTPPPETLGQSPALLRGIEQYREENYEEAIEILKEARREDPTSSSAAFFLGMSYKQTLDNHKALEQFRDAVTLTPRIKEALVELIAVSYQLSPAENLGEAKKWVAVAEREGIFPARVAFLKGLILQKEGRNMEAIESFEKAKALDDTLAQSADIQIGTSYMRERKLKEASKRFQAAILHDPRTDLAGFARRYQDLTDKRIFLERPLRVTLGVFGQYDTNVVLKPGEPALAPDITDEGSRATTTSLRLDYVPILEGPWLFNAQYAFFGNFHDKHSTTHDVITNSLYLAPGYDFGKFALNLPVSYSHALVRSPSYKKFLHSVNLGPLFRVLLNQSQVLEMFGGYHWDDYFRAPLIPEEDRDANGATAYVSWIWVFMEEAFFNLRYDFTDSDTSGVNWDNDAHGFTLNTTLPLVDKLKLQLSGQVFFQDYKKTHTVFGVKRKDENYQGSIGLTWEFFEHLSLVLQFTASRFDSNIAIYDYDRELYSAGLEYRF